MAKDVREIGDATLILGDCREVLPTLSAVDSVITDPVWPNVPPGAVPGSDDPHGLWRDACAAMPDHKRMIVVMRGDSDPRFLEPVEGDFFRMIQLPYACPSYRGRLLMSDEYAYWYGKPPVFAKGRRLVPGRGPTSQPQPKNGHPMPRSQSHCDWLVEWASDPGETVLDPFMGSGSTGVAAARVGRRFVGIEIDPDFFQIAVNRIAEEAAQSSIPKLGGASA